MRKSNHTSFRRATWQGFVARLSQNPIWRWISWSTSDVQWRCQNDNCGPSKTAHRVWPRRTVNQSPPSVTPPVVHVVNHRHNDNNQQHAATVEDIFHTQVAEALVQHTARRATSAQKPDTSAEFVEASRRINQPEVHHAIKTVADFRHDNCSTSLPINHVNSDPTTTDLFTDPSVR